MVGCWVLEVDIRSFFDTVKFDHLREFLKKRVRDGVLFFWVLPITGIN